MLGGIGMAVFAVGLLLLALLPEHPSNLDMVWRMALCGAGLMSFPIACAVLIAAAILGDQCNYTIGRFFGPKVFQWENSRFFNKAAFDRSHNFYERYGGITIILARFMPFLRTFAPFVFPGLKPTSTRSFGR